MLLRPEYSDSSETLSHNQKHGCFDLALFPTWAVSCSGEITTDAELGADKRKGTASYYHLEFLCLSDPSASASQVAGTTGTCHIQLDSNVEILFIGI